MAEYVNIIITVYIQIIYSYVANRHTNSKQIQKQYLTKGRDSIKDLLNPKTDYVFKRIFGYTGNEEITKSLIKAITKENIEEITLDCNPITEKDLLDDKVGILDIKAKLNNNTNCNIEMQVIDQKDIEKRILYYWSKMYSQSIKQGNEYQKLEKCISILITDFNLERLKGIQEFITKWNIRETKNPQIILTEMLELYIIETNKAVGKDSSDELNSWLQFINNPREKTSMENKEIKKARKVLEEISQDEHERYLAELRQKYIMDQKAIEDAGYDKGVKAGLEQGIEKGIEQGNRQKQIEIAKKLKEMKIDIETIEKSTGLTEDEIENL